MNPLGNPANHLFIPTKDGKALQFIDEPTCSVKCYERVKGLANVTLGKAIPVNDNGEVFFVKKSDLYAALGLNEQTSSDDDLETELTWRELTHTFKDVDIKSPTAPGAKELAICWIYALKTDEAEESIRWMEAAESKGFPVTPGMIHSLLNEHLSLLEYGESLPIAGIELLHALAEKKPTLFVPCIDDLEALFENDLDTALSLSQLLCRNTSMLLLIDEITDIDYIVSEEDLEQIGMDAILHAENEADAEENITDLEGVLIVNHTELFFRLTIEAAKRFDPLCKKVIHYALQGGHTPIQGVKDLAALNQPSALRALPEIELIDYLRLIDLKTFSTDAPHAALEKYIMDHPAPKRIYVLHYLAEPSERFPADSENFSGTTLITRISQNHAIARSIKQDRVLALLERTESNDMKIKLLKVLIQKCTDSVSIVRMATTFPELLTDLLENYKYPFLKRCLNPEELKTFENAAIAICRESPHGGKVAIQYLKETAYMLTSEDYYTQYVHEVLYAFKHHGEFIDDLCEIALKGHSEAIALLERNDPKIVERHQSYLFKKAFLKLDHKTLFKDLDSAFWKSKQPLPDYLQLEEILKGQRVLFNPAPPKDAVDKEELLAVLKARHYPQFLPHLVNISLRGSKFALKSLKKFAAEGNVLAANALAQFEFQKTIQGGHIELIRSAVYNRAVETLVADPRYIQDDAANTALFLYLLPPELRLSWESHPNKPINLLTAGDPSLPNNKIRKAVLHGIDAALHSEMSPQMFWAIAQYTREHQNELRLNNDDPLMQLVAYILTAFLIQDAKNPLTLFNHLQQLKDMPITFTTTPMSVEGKVVGFNIPQIQALASGLRVPVSALHQDVTWDRWVALIQQIHNKQADPAVAQATNEGTIGGWNDLVLTCLNDTGFFRPRIEYQDETVPFNYAQLNAILHKIFNLSDEGYPLSPKEDLFIKFAESVKNCQGGKFEGVSLFYTNGLGKKEKLSIDIPDESDLAKAKAKSTLAAEFQKCIGMQFDVSSALMKQLINDPDVVPDAHYSIYLKNLIGHLVGLQHELYFDVFTLMLSNNLIQATREEALEAFYKHLTPQTLVDRLHAWMIRDSEKAGRKNWDKLFTLVTPADEDMVWDPDTDLPVEPTKIYARKLLEAAGYLTGEFS